MWTALGKLIRNYLIYAAEGTQTFPKDGTPNAYYKGFHLEWFVDEQGHRHSVYIRDPEKR